MSKFPEHPENVFPFVNLRPNVVHLNFSNGNHLSTIWGGGTYTRNHDRIGEWDTFMGSPTVEVMLDCNQRLKSKIYKQYDFNGSVKGHLSIMEWLDIVNQLASAPKWGNSPYLKQLKETP